MAIIFCGVIWSSAEIVQGSDSQFSTWDAAWMRLDAGDHSGAQALFLARLEVEPSDLAAADGLITTGILSCSLPSSISALEDIVARQSDQVAPGLQAFLAGARLLEQRTIAAACDEFTRASDLAWAAGDTFSAAVARQRAGTCQLRLGQPEGTAAQSREFRRLIASEPEWLRLQLECDILAAGANNLDARLSAADSIYVLVVEKAESAGFKTILCIALNGRGTIGSKQRQPATSIPWFKRSLALARELEDLPRTAKILKNLGYDHTQARQVSQALDCYEEARALAAQCGLQGMLGHIHTGFGAIAEVLGDRQKAIEHFRNSYLAHSSLGDWRGELGARQRLAYNLMISGRYSEAITHFDRCLELIDEGDSPYLLNWVLGGLALTHHKLGYLDRAEDFYLRAMTANENLGDRISVAWCHLSLGWLEMLRGDYRQALVRSHEALEIYGQLGDAEGVGDSHVVIAEVHFRLGDWDQAREDYLLGANLGLENGLEEIQNRAYRGLAEVCSAANRPEEAKLYCERALELARSWSDNNGTIWALIQLAEQSLARGNPDAARRRLADASSHLDPEGHFEFRSHARLLQARCADRPGEAIGLAGEALALAEEGCLPEREWAALTDLGTYQLAAGDTGAARRSQLQAIEVVESLRRAVGTDELRRHMLRPALAPYERMIQLSLGGGQPDAGRALEALAVSERSRAQVLTARLQGARQGGAAEGRGGSGAEERELLAGIAYLQGRLQETGLALVERNDLREQVGRLEDDIQILRLETNSIEHSPGTGYLPSHSPEELLAVLGADEQAVSYFLGEEESILFHVTGERVRAVRLPGRAVLESRVRRYLSLREGRSVPGSILETAERGLFSLLLGPVANDLSANGTLIVIPDGILHRLPFSTLRGPRGRVVDHHQVFIAPSLWTLASLRQRAIRRARSEPAPDLSILAVGCGATNNFAGESGNDPIRRVHPFDGSPVAALAGAAEEARQVAELFHRSMELTGSAADEASIKAAPLNRAEVLHIAAHSYADDREVRRSYVLLNSNGRAGLPGESVEDGLLQWGEAAALDLRASLVTLAACRSAGGVLSVGEGVTGLTQAFLFAGATCVLAVQSDIADEYSRRFMLAFYRHFRGGVSAAEALRRVQMEFAGRLTNGGGRDPWADFVLVGDGSVTLKTGFDGGLSRQWKRFLIFPAAMMLTLLIISIGRGRR